MSMAKKFLGVRLDVGCGERKQTGFIGLDKVALEGVDIVHDLEVFPYPLDDEECHVVLARYVIEYLKPWLIIDIFNELWRITKPGGQLVISTPYAGSEYFWHDPARCNGFTEASFLYFDRRHLLWNVHKPKPWITDPGFPAWQPNGMLEIVMTRVGEDYDPAEEKRD
jgi:SAM-dependent methyltransferase